MPVWKPVVAGVDTSPESAVAATLAWRMAREAGTDCVLVHGTQRVSDIPAMVPATTDLRELTAHFTAAARQRVETALRDRVPSEALQQLKVRLDNPTWALRHAVEEHRAGLVLLGGKRRGAATRWLGGSTAHHAIRTLDVPVLVTAGDDAPFRRVLAAVDLSYAAGPTIEMALRLTRLFEAELRLLHVVEGIPDFMASAPSVLNEVEYHRQAEARFAAIVADLVNDTPAESIVRTGSPADVIADESDRWGADLVIVGSHGKGWVDRVIIGSTAERLLNRLPTATLIVSVRAPKGAATTLMSAAVGSRG